LHGEEEAFDVGVEDAVEVVFFNGAEGCVFGDAGVSEDDVELAFFFLNLRDETVEIF
jgi:hypothetical protein